jgi:hypothetical protein
MLLLGVKLLERILRYHFSLLYSKPPGRNGEKMQKYLHIQYASSIHNEKERFTNELKKNCVPIVTLTLAPGAIFI